MWTAVTKTNTGNVRTNNEDLALWDSELGVLVIADGMGGHNAGEVASRLAVEALYKSLQQTASGGLEAADRLREAVTRANREVFRTSKERPECAGMGTTMTAALVEADRVRYASVGGSRLTLKNGALQQMTRDDSLMGALIDVAGIDPAELEHHPMRHLLTSVVGRKAELDVTVEEPWPMVRCSCSRRHARAADRVDRRDSPRGSGPRPRRSAAHRRRSRQTAKTTSRSSSRDSPEPPENEETARRLVS
jgi:protein phosphatase